MTMDQAATFLAGSILIMVALIVIITGAVIINNIIHKYWKTFGWTFMPSWSQEPVRFLDPEEVDKGREPKVK